MGRLLFQPQARQALKAGVDRLAAAVCPTLGPTAGLVALGDSTRGGSPELLDDGGAIARRILQLPDRGADVGAMLLREALWRQKERYGDGAATVAVLYQCVFDEGQRYISAGGDAMALRRRLERGLAVMLEALGEQVRPLNGAKEMEGLAYGICGDEEAASALADIFEVLGPHQPVETREGGRGLRHEFFLGSYWEAKVPSDTVFEGALGKRVALRNSAWLISDFALEELDTLVSLATDVYQAEFDSLVIVAKSFSQQIIAAQAANSRMEDFTLVYLQLAGLLDEQEAALEDLALITGGQALRAMAGDSLKAVHRGQLGVSELAWVDRDRFGLMAGGGDRERVACEAGRLEGLYSLAEDDERRAEILRARIGRLRGGSAVIYCGGSSESEMRYRQNRIEGAIAALRGALLCGTVAGGGTALLRCVPRLQDCHDNCADENERAAYRILMRAAAAPCRTLLTNAGCEAPGLIVDEICRGENGTGYDVRVGEMVDMRERGLVDSAAAVMAAVRHGIGGAALALTVEAIVHRVNPPLAIEPGARPAKGPAHIEVK